MSVNHFTTVTNRFRITATFNDTRTWKLKNQTNVTLPTIITIIIMIVGNNYNNNYYDNKHRILKVETNNGLKSTNENP